MSTNVIKIILISFFALLILCVSAQAIERFFWNEDYSDDMTLNEDGFIYYQNFTVPSGIVNITQIRMGGMFKSEWGGLNGFLKVGIFENPMPTPENFSWTNALDYEEIAPHELSTYFSRCSYNFTMSDGAFVAGPATYVVALELDITDSGEVETGYYNDATMPTKYRYMYADPSATPYSWSAPATRNLSIWVYGERYGMLTFTNSSIEESSATLGVNLTGDAGESTTVGVWVGTSSTSKTAFIKNVTISSTATAGTYTKSITGLVPGTYYYYRGWATNGFGFINDTSEGYFMTKPNPPDDLTLRYRNATNATFTWTNATHNVSDQTTVIIYSTEGYPQWTGTAWSNSGTVGYNGTDEFCTIEGLEADSTYFYSAYTYINGSGSPFYWWYSDLFDYVGAEPVVGDYTIYIRWECNDSLVILGGLYQNHTFRFLNSSGEELNESHPYTNPFYHSPLDVPELAEFKYNNTYYRNVIVDPGEYNVTIYVPCGEEGYDIGDVTGVSIFFNDYTGLLTPEHEAIGFLYRYNGSTKEYIHMDYLQADKAIRTYVTIGETYHVGVGCSYFTKYDLRELLILEDYNEYWVDVVYIKNDTGTIYLIANISKGWDGDTMYLDIFDKTHSGEYGIQNASISLYYLSNDTLANFTYEGVPWDFNYTWEGNTSVSYYAILNVVYLSSEESWNGTIYIYWLSTGETIVSDSSYIDDVFDSTLGISPIYYGDETISWTALIVICVITFLLFVFSPRYVGMCIMSIGIVLAFLKLGIGIIPDSTLSTGVIVIIVLLGFLSFLVMRRLT